MFRGSSPLSLDSKGRLSIPSRFRKEIQECCGGQLLVTVDNEGCLLIYPLPEWEIFEQKLMQLSGTNKAARRLQRLMTGNAEELDMDASGRILLPAHLREFANLDKRVRLVGQRNKFELWNEQTWRQMMENWKSGEDDAGLLPDLSF